ncbi:MAG: restriction endonuclease [Terrisporobacter othiniensis]|nr:restriction endonuclease [Terrisporobacter othiniensis]MDU6994254.1 restriction endonuclease [Terrisporobacter othiniensis]
MGEKLNKNIKLVEKDKKKHAKASEEYIHVEFLYPETQNIWDGWVPIVYRRTGLHLENKDEIYKHLNKVYEQMKPDKILEWKKKQEEYWKNSRALTTKSFFDSLIKGGWQCVDCTLPKNPNWARRIQDLKEGGYTISTDINRYCPKCKSKKTHLILLPIERGASNGNGYETWSPELRKRIIKVLNSVDVYENKVNPHCLPDHKFSEIRWDLNTKATNPNDMTDEQIREKFQLLTNQRNQQKREVCRRCFQTGIRGIIYGIPFFYEGTEKWDESISKIGKDAERGCVGCPWYDIEEWRKRLIQNLKKCK